MDKSETVKDGDSPGEETKGNGGCLCSPKVRASKNLVGVFSSFILGSGAILGLISLQSSINSEKGLGLTSAAVTFAIQIVFLFFVPAVIGLIGSKYSLLAGFILYLLYIPVNYYPHWGTLIPGSVLLGVGKALAFTNARIHTTAIAIKYASALKESTENAIALVAGLFGMSLRLSEAVGGIVSSVVLFNVDHNRKANSSNNASNVACSNTEAEFLEQDYLYFVLITVYVFMAIMSIVLTLMVVDNLGTESKFRSVSGLLKESILKRTINTAKLLITDWKIVFMFPTFVLAGLSDAFIYGEFLKTIVSDCVGVQWVGFVFLTHAMTSAITSVVLGRLCRYISESFMIYTSGCLATGLSLFLIFWMREPNLYAIFGIVIGWGLSSASWQAVIPGYIGSLFADKKEAALSLFEIGFSLGFIISFLLSLFVPFDAQLWVLVAAITIAITGYSVVFIQSKKKQLSLFCCKNSNNESNAAATSVGTYELKEAY